LEWVSDANCAAPRSTSACSHAESARRLLNKPALDAHGD